MKSLYWIITFFLLFILIIVRTFIMRYNLFKKYSQVIVFIVLFTELSFTIITIVAYVCLFHLVPLKTRAMASKTHARADSNKILTLNLTCTYQCLLLFTLQQVPMQIIQFSKAMKDLRMIINLKYWGNALSKSNCYANAILIL